MTPKKAARRLVRHADRAVFDDYWNLIDPQSPIDDEMRKRYRKLQRSVKRAENIAPAKITKLERRVVKSVPKTYRDRLKRSLNTLSDAETDEMRVQELCAFVIGREVGRRRR
jgi:hypothetical protein